MVEYFIDDFFGCSLKKEGKKKYLFLWNFHLEELGRWEDFNDLNEYDRSIAERALKGSKRISEKRFNQKKKKMKEVRIRFMMDKL